MKFTKYILIIVALLMVANIASATVYSEDDENDADGNGVHTIGTENGEVVDNNYSGIDDKEEELPIVGTEQCFEYYEERNPDALNIDYDDDGWADVCDNCTRIPNASENGFDQVDSDDDGVGDACFRKRNLEPEDLPEPEGDENELPPEDEGDGENTPTGLGTLNADGSGMCSLNLAANSNMLMILIPTLAGLIIRRKTKT